MSSVLPVGVVIPTLNAAKWIDECLLSVERQSPAQIVVVDGGSRDGTVARVMARGVTVLFHRGAGPGAARQVGVGEIKQPWLALVDADIILPEGALAGLLDELHATGADGIQARLEHASSRGYWSTQLARHHNEGHSGNWFGVSAALVKSATLRQVPFDARLASGEDVDLRRRMEQSGHCVVVSSSIVVRHHYGSGFRVALDQWLADGAGYGRLVRKEGFAMVPWAFLPLAAAMLGMLRSTRDHFRSVPYYVGHALGNLVGTWRGLSDRRIPTHGHAAMAAASTLVLVALVMIALVGLPLTIGFLVAANLSDLARAARGADWLVVPTAAFIALLVARELALRRDSAALNRQSALDSLLVLSGLFLAGAGGLRLAAILGLL